MVDNLFDLFAEIVFFGGFCVVFEVGDIFVRSTGFMGWAARHC